MPQFEQIFAALRSAAVRYVVVGGVAVNLRGYQRFTKDLHLVVELIPDNARRALEALQGLGYKPNIPVKAADFADPEIRASWIRDKGVMVFQMYSDRSRVTVDIFVEHPIPLRRALVGGNCDRTARSGASDRFRRSPHADETSRCPTAGSA